MKRLFLPVLLIIFVSFGFISACGNDVEEEVPDKHLELTFNGDVMTLPVSYNDLAAYGFGFDAAAYGNVEEDTKVEGHTLFSETYTTENGIMTVLYANLSTGKKKASECYVVGLDVAKFNDKDGGVDVEYDGLSWKSSADDIEEKLGTPYQNGTQGGYELFEYKLENDIYVSFTTDEDGIIEYTLAIEYPEIEFENMEVSDNVTY